MHDENKTTKSEIDRRILASGRITVIQHMYAANTKSQSSRGLLARDYMQDLLLRS